MVTTTEKNSPIPITGAGGGGAQPTYSYWKPASTLPHVNKHTDLVLVLLLDSLQQMVSRKIAVVLYKAQYTTLRMEQQTQANCNGVLFLPGRGWSEFLDPGPLFTI